MRRFWSSAFVGAMALITVSAAHAKPVEFGNQPVAAGDVFDETQAMTMNIDMEMSMGEGGSMNMSMNIQESNTHKIAVKEVGAEGPQKINVTVVAGSKTETMMGQVNTTPNPNVGQSFDGEAGVAIDGPGDVPVKGAFRALDDMLVNRTDSPLPSIEIGTTIDAKDMLTGGLVPAPGEDIKLESGTLTLREVVKEGASKVAVFDMVMKLTGQDPKQGLKMTLDMSGTIKIDTKTGWLNAMELAGPITMAGSTETNGIAMTMNGKGNFTVTKTIAPAK